ncbi:MAG: AtpZ/AtpI family protein [Armatimonadetes bacterium]|nr:AtpZ/AtpI family protein [Armatimonadota bacterium]
MNDGPEPNSDDLEREIAEIEAQLQKPDPLDALIKPEQDPLADIHAKGDELIAGIGTRKFELPEPPSTEIVQERIKAATGKSVQEVREELHPAKEKEAMKDLQSTNRSTTMALQVAYGLLAIPCAFIALGWLLQKYAGMPASANPIVILFGLILGFYVTFRRMNELNK